MDFGLVQQNSYVLKPRVGDRGLSASPDVGTVVFSALIGLSRIRDVLPLSETVESCQSVPRILSYMD